ncbi:MAG: glycosyltransferase [Deltaproteobacteria bacterium]|nr:glycosyltransferase [Deltaproteobacteria bacterium]
MRILSILQYSPPSRAYGGAERQLHSIHKGLLSRGIDVQVLADISYVKSPYQVFEAVPIWGVRFPALPRSVLSFPLMIRSWIRLKSLLSLIKKNIGQIDLIQITPIRETALWGFWLSRALHVPWVGRIACSGSYGDFHYISKYMVRNLMVKKLIPEILKDCSAAIALDHETYREAVDNGVRKDRVFIIPNAITFDEFPSIEEAAKIPEDGILLFLGRIALQKRLTDVLKAYALYKQKKYKSRTKSSPILNIVGGGDVSELKRLADRLGIEESVKFCGQHADVTTFLKRAICMINASESEGMPNAVLEACACGVPGILSDIPIHREIAIQTGMEDFLFPVGDETRLSERISRYLSLEEKEVVQKRIRSFDFAQGFRKERRDEAYCTLYDRIVKAYGLDNKESKEGN